MALDYAKKYHGAQTDLNGKPYMGHLMRVAQRVAKSGPNAIMVALLHDILEDTKVGTDELIEIFPPEVIRAVWALTRIQTEHYKEYIKHVAEVPLALEVKIADLKDNLDPVRQRTGQVNEDRTRRYEKALTYLEGKNE